MIPTSKSVRLMLGVTSLVTLAVVMAFAQSNSELYRSGQIGYANGNCVKAARFWFAYLIREPAELAADPNLRAKIERVIRECDEEPMRYASTAVVYAKKPRSKEGSCQIYAELAVAQFEASQLAGCKLTGSRWSSDYAFHYKWCVAVDALNASLERSARDQALSSCTR
jgi:hypothetical protein